MRVWGWIGGSWFASIMFCSSVFGSVLVYNQLPTGAVRWRRLLDGTIYSVYTVYPSGATARSLLMKGENMLLQKVRKVGNSYVVTIPREVMESQGIHEGDTVAVEVRKVGHQVRMDPDVRAAFERSMEIYK